MGVCVVQDFQDSLCLSQPYPVMVNFWEGFWTSWTGAGEGILATLNRFPTRVDKEISSMAHRVSFPTLTPALDQGYSQVELRF